MKRRFIVILAATVIAGCARLPLPSLGGDGDPSLMGLVENRVWVEQGALVPGTARAWLSSGQLVTTSCFAVPRLTEWRWVGSTLLEWIEAEERVTAEVAAAGPEELVLLIGEGDAPSTVRFSAAQADELC